MMSSRIYYIEKAIMILLICVVILEVLLSANTFAYELLGGRWTDSDVKDLSYRVKSGIPYVSDIREVFADAAASWENTVAYGVPHFYEVSSGEKIIVNAYYEEYGALAYAYADPSLYAYPYEYAYIHVNTYYLDVAYYLSYEHFQGVLAHEIGHILGLAHETEYGPIVLMWPTDEFYIECGIYEPTLDEIYGVMDLYGG